MTLKTIGHLSQPTSFSSHWEIQTGVTVRKLPIWVKIGDFCVPCDLEIRWMTLKNNRAPLLCFFKFCASFRSHILIQSGVTVQKRINWVFTSVTLTFDLWPWPFAWTSLLSLIITPKYIMMRWWEYSGKGVTDRQTDGRTDRRTDGSVLRAALPQLRKCFLCVISGTYACQVWPTAKSVYGNLTWTLYIP